MEWILQQFGRTRRIAVREYKVFVLEGLKKGSPWGDVKNQIVLGDESFIEKIRSLIEDKKKIKEIPIVQRNAGRPPLNEIFGECPVKNRKSRNDNIYTAHVRYGYTLKEIADYLSIHYSTVSKGLKHK